MKTTRSQILDAAEAVFAERGLSASIRAVTAAADVNVAAIHYHFGSKDALVLEVLSRRILPVNEKRIRLLDEAEVRASGGVVPLEDILTAFFVPAFELGSRPAGKRFMRMMARTMVDPNPTVYELQTTLFRDVFLRFSAALARTLPELPSEELRWRFRFLLGSMIHGLLMDSAPMMKTTTRASSTAVVRRLVSFVAAGLRAEVSTT